MQKGNKIGKEKKVNTKRRKKEKAKEDTNNFKEYGKEKID